MSHLGEVIGGGPKSQKEQVHPEEPIPMVDDDEGGEDFGEFRDLFIQGHALNAEQIEALDLNLLELSLQNQQTDHSEEQDLRRLESFSPELEKFNEQNFKIDSNLKKEIERHTKKNPEFNFTFNQLENPVKQFHDDVPPMKKVQLFSPQAGQKSNNSCRRAPLLNVDFESEVN